MADVLIIGGGVSGLSAGIYAQMSGHRAMICERHGRMGGNLTGWKREGYLIDNCIHWLTGTNPASDTYKMWVDLGVLGNVEVHYSDVLYSCTLEGESMALYRSLDRTCERMLEISQDDRSEIFSFIRAVELMQGCCKIGGEKHDRHIKIIDLIRGIPTLYKYYDLTVGELSERFLHPLLRLFMGSFWGKDFGALALIAVCAHFCGDNGGIPQGGSCDMALRMEKRFLSLGGEIRKGYAAVKINTEGNRAVSVTFMNGDVIAADHIIVTCDPSEVFGKMIDIGMPAGLARMYHDSRLKRFSSCHCAFACDTDKVSFEGDRILKVSDRNVKDLHADVITVREFSHEPSFCPQGKVILQTMAFCDEKDARRFISLKDMSIDKYKNKKLQLSEAVKEELESQLPYLRGKIRCIDVWTPATYRRYVASEIGSYMSFILPSRYLPRRLDCRVKGVKGLYLATQWQQLPGGLPIAAMSGKKAVEAINRMHKSRNEDRFGVDKVCDM